MKNRKSFIDYLVVLATPLIAAAITVYFKTPMLLSISIFFALPSIYLTYRMPSILKKGLIMSIASIPFTIIIDYFAQKDGSWWDETIFPFRFLNGHPLEDFLWCITWFYFIIAFYEYFIDEPRGGRDIPPNKKHRILLIGWYSASLIFLFFYGLIDTYVHLPYFYVLFASTLGVIPLVLTLLKHPHLFPKFMLAGIYFFYVNLSHELSALHAGQWSFPGSNFIGWVQIFKFRFPVEEFTLWMMLGAMYVLTWYEHFVDDDN